MAAATEETTAMATATERTSAIARPRPGGRRASGPDRLTVVLVSIAAFLLVLALLADQLRSSSTPLARRPVIVLRRVYETRIVETARGFSAAGAGGTSVTQSVSSSGSAAAPAAPTTRSS
jgi:hypothetical protein